MVIYLTVIPPLRYQIEIVNYPGTMLKGLTMLKPVLLFCFVAAFIATAFACNGCSIKKYVVTPCAKNNVMEFQLDSAVLTKDCVFKPRGWFNVSKTVTEMKSKWQFQKGLLKKSGESDGCEEMVKASKDKEIRELMKTFNMPDRCPIQKGNLRINKDVNLSSYKDKMRLLNGPSSGKMDISHGSAGRTCLTFDALVECKSN